LIFANSALRSTTLAVLRRFFITIWYWWNPKNDFNPIEKDQQKRNLCAREKCAENDVGLTPGRIF